MADNSYGIEIKLASKNSWFTPAEAKAYYGRYARDGVTVHWWGGGEPASAHDNIVKYFLSQGVAGNKSVNYVISDNKISLMVNPDNVAWCSQAGNPTTISIEHQPTLGAEGYKKSGWTIEQLEQRYNRRLPIYPHYKWISTVCSGTISLDRIAQEVDKWRRKVYDQPPPQPISAPTPTPPPPANNPVVTPIPLAKKYTLDNAKLLNIKDLSVVKTFPLDTPIDIGGVCEYNGKQFLVSVYATQKNTLQGFLIGDLKDGIGNPTPPATPPPDPVPPTAPEWVTNLRDIDDTKFWFKEDTDLVDITTGKPTGTKIFKEDEEFVCSALTQVGGVEYRITDYSYKKGIFNGVPISKLTLTPPGVPDIPPVPNYPVTDKNAVIAFLELIGKLISEFIAKLKGEK